MGPRMSCDVSVGSMMESRAVKLTVKNSTGEPMNSTALHDFLSVAVFSKGQRFQVWRGGRTLRGLQLRQHGSTGCVSLDSGRAPYLCRNGCSLANLMIS